MQSFTLYGFLSHLTKVTGRGHVEGVHPDERRQLGARGPLFRSAWGLRVPLGEPAPPPWHPHGGSAWDVMNKTGSDKNQPLNPKNTTVFGGRLRGGGHPDRAMGSADGRSVTDKEVAPQKGAPHTKRRVPPRDGAWHVRLLPSRWLADVSLAPLVKNESLLIPLPSAETVKVRTWHV